VFVRFNKEIYSCDSTGIFRAAYVVEW